MKPTVHMMYTLHTRIEDVHMYLNFSLCKWKMVIQSMLLLSTVTNWTNFQLSL